MLKQYTKEYAPTALGILVFGGLFVLGVYAFFSPSALATHIAQNKNIADMSATSTEHWAWNDIIGWVDMRNSNIVKVGDYSMEGYGLSSSMGEFAFDCATAPGADCNPPYHVSNDRRGRLSGWAWNDIIGWISFCGETSNLLADCLDLAANPYRVLIDRSNGKFSGYAWNDAVGWFSFDSAQHVPNAACDDLNAGNRYCTITEWRPTATTGTIESIVYDTSVQGGAQLNSIVWRGITPGDSLVDFEIAVSDNLTLDDLTQYDISAPSDQAPFRVHNGAEEYRVILNDANREKLYNKRYIRYKVNLSDGAGLETPRVDEIIMNWSP